MFKPISDKVSLPDLEKEILAYWKTHRIFEKSVEGRQNAPDYTFYEGPPTANGKPGIHHVFARTIKDLVCRLLLEKKNNNQLHTFCQQPKRLRSWSRINLHTKP